MDHRAARMRAGIPVMSYFILRVQANQDGEQTMAIIKLKRIR